MTAAGDHPQSPARRRILGGLAALGLLSLSAPAAAQSLDATALNVALDSLEDQSGVLQEALLRAAAEKRPLFLPAGTYYAQNLQVPSNVAIVGVPGATNLAAAGEEAIARITGSARVTLDGIGFTRGNGGPAGAERGLLEIDASDHVMLTSCTFTGGVANGLFIRDAAAAISGCDFLGHGLAAIFSRDSRGLTITGNRIENCGNGGILIWGTFNRRDGSVITNNAITKIAYSNGGNGQNGNGINIFNCNDVIVADNQISECAFTAIRLNSTSNVTVTGNICRESGEVAIFSEFAFTGSLIANNIVDGAATGISITNMDKGGSVAVCTGNIIRNVRASSRVNPDTRPIGIYAEAETVVSGNTLSNVAGTAIRAGNGTFLRNVVISDNVIYGVNIGIGVSVVQNPGPGPVRIDGNLITDPAEAGIVGMEWEKVVTTDLVRDAARYPHVVIGTNQVQAIR